MADPHAVAVDACRTAMASQMGLAVAQVTIQSVVPSEASVAVRPTVDGAEAPWECLSDLKGEIVAVSFVGEEADN
jgi:hypothetical protein